VKPKSESILWRCHSETETFLAALVDQYVSRSARLRELRAELLRETSTSLGDWIDHVVLADSKEMQKRARELGFEREDVPVEAGSSAYYHPAALFPRIVLQRMSGPSDGEIIGVALQVESIGQFLIHQEFQATIEGSPLSSYRRAIVEQGNGRKHIVVERRGHRGYIPWI